MPVLGNQGGKRRKTGASEGARTWSWAGPGPSPRGFGCGAAQGSKEQPTSGSHAARKPCREDFLPLQLQSFCRCVSRPGRTKPRGCKLAPARVSPARLLGDAGGRKLDRAVPVSTVEPQHGENEVTSGTFDLICWVFFFLHGVILLERDW